MPQHQVLGLVPSPVLLAVLAVGQPLGMALAVLLPQQAPGHALAPEFGSQSRYGLPPAWIDGVNPIPDGS